MAKYNYSFTLLLAIFLLEGLAHYFVELSTAGPGGENLRQAKENTVILKYEFYPRNRTKDKDPCLAETKWDQSTTFSFSDQSPLPNLKVKNGSIQSDQLRINCISSEPLQWILDVPTVPLGKLANYYLHPADAEGSAKFRYHICITFENLTRLSGTVRCESIVNGTIGAEIYIQNEGIPPYLGSCGKEKSMALLMGNNSKNIVPCKIKGGRTDKDALRIQLLENRAMENSTSVAQTAMISTPQNYDPRIGFRLDKPIIRNSTYQCKNFHDPEDCEQFLAAFTMMDQKIGAKIEYNRGNHDHSVPDKIQCSTEYSNIKLHLHVVQCSKLPSCALRNVGGFRPPYPQISLKIRNSTDEGEDSSSHVVTTTTVPKSGMAYCHGISLENGSYVEEFDYFFDGLSGSKYFVSEDFPAEEVIELKPVFPDPNSGVKHRFYCKISTFVLFRLFNITVEFGPGKLKHFHVHSDPNPREQLRTADYEISGARKSKNEPISIVWINVYSDALTSVSCSAAFTYKKGWATVKSPVRSTSSRPMELIVAFAALGIVALLAILTAALFLWKYKRTKASKQWLTPEEIRQFRFGSNAVSTGPDSSGNVAIRLATLTKDGLLDVNSLTFPPDFQIPWNQLQICRDDLLGEGAFSFCYRGKFNGAEVAVKMLKPSIEREDFKNCLKEAKLMANLGQHPHIIRFYGAVIEKLHQNIVPVVLELSPNGNLKALLQERGNQIVAGNGDEVLLSFCAQIATGMEYLSHKNVVHGDLAARNVLVFEDLTVKITDFGLSKNLYESSYYSRRDQKVPLPWRWMAPESLEHLKFSAHSDVWSFGVTAWEIFTFGQMPFPEHAWTADFMKQLRHHGLRLPKPDRATEKIYGFLNLCWSIDPSHRPPFTEIKKFFICLLQDNHDGETGNVYVKTYFLY